MEFYSPQTSGDLELIRVSIKPHWDQLLPYVYNLAMVLLQSQMEKTIDL